MNLGLLHSDTLKKITGAVDYNKQQTVREKMRKFKSHKANFCFFAGTSFSLAKNFALLSFQFLREKTADCFWKQIYL